MNQVLTREEVAALLQGVAESESDRRKGDQANKAKRPDKASKAKDQRKVQRWYLVGSPR